MSKTALVALALVPLGVATACQSSAGNLTVTPVQAGDGDCPQGGTRFTDAAGSVSFACNGALGGPGPQGEQGASIAGLPLEPGDFHCPYDGVAFGTSSGTQYLCKDASEERPLSEKVGLPAILPFSTAVSGGSLPAGYALDFYGLGSASAVEPQTGTDASGLPLVQPRPGVGRYREVVFRRGVVADTAWSQWMSAFRSGGAVARDDLVVTLYNPTLTPVASWTLADAWPIRHRVLSLVDGAGNQTPVEELVVAFASFDRGAVNTSLVNGNWTVTASVAPLSALLTDVEGLADVVLADETQATGPSGEPLLAKVPAGLSGRLVTLERFVDSNSGFHDWRKQLMAAPTDSANLDTVVIELRAPNTTLIAAWTLVNAWPVSLETSIDYDGLVRERLQLAYDSLTRTN